MALRSFTKLSLILAPLFLGGAALAQAPGVTTGPESESGKNVEPSTGIQKEAPGPPPASVEELQGSSEAAGAPGMEAKPGTQAGEAPKGQPSAPKRAK